MRELTTPMSNAARSSVVVAPALLGAGDPGSTRLVYAMVIGLVVIGFSFVLLGIWLFRQTKYDPPVLAPLERMGDKDWRRQSDPATQRRVLDEVRPEGAEPLRLESSPPNLDAEFELAARPVTSMSDLEPSKLSVERSQTVVAPLTPEPAVESEEPAAESEELAVESEEPAPESEEPAVESEEPEPEEIERSDESAIVEGSADGVDR